MDRDGDPVVDQDSRFLGQLGRLLLAGFVVVAAAAVAAKFAASLGLTDIAVGSVFGLSVVGLIIYFVPAIIAYTRHNNQSKAIFVLNLLLGWTALGWIAALVWAFTNSTVVVQNVSPHRGRGAWKRCPRCAEDVRAEAVICRYCQHEFAVPVTVSPLVAVAPTAETVAGGGPPLDLSGAEGFGRLALIALALSTVIAISGVIGWLVYQSWLESERIQARRVARPPVSTAVQSTATAVPALASPGDVSPLRQWTGAISATIHARMNPSAATGTAGGRATIRFTVTRDGEVKDVAVAVSSGNDQIDSAALAAVQGSQPPAPVGVTQQSLSVSMPLIYRVR